MAPKRKREEQQADLVHRPEAGTKSFATGKAVRDGLQSGSRQGVSPSPLIADNSDRFVPPADCDAVLPTSPPDHSPDCAHPAAVPRAVSYRR